MRSEQEQGGASAQEQGGSDKEEQARPSKINEEREQVREKQGPFRVYHHSEVISL